MLNCQPKPKKSHSFNLSVPQKSVKFQSDRRTFDRASRRYFSKKTSIQKVLKIWKVWLNCYDLDRFRKQTTPRHIPNSKFWSSKWGHYPFYRDREKYSRLNFRPILGRYGTKNPYFVSNIFHIEERGRVRVRSTAGRMVLFELSVRLPSLGVITQAWRIQSNILSINWWYRGTKRKKTSNVRIDKRSKQKLSRFIENVRYGRYP